jgi:hypothetical protein
VSGSTIGYLHTNFAATALGAVIAFGIVLLTVDVSDAETHAAIVALFAVSTVALIYFAVLALVFRRKSHDVLTRIRQQR